MSLSHSSAPALSLREIKTLMLAALGGALEFYDFIIFIFFATLIGQLFFPEDLPLWLRQLQTFALFAAGYLARPLGGALMAHYGDRLGRKKIFSLSILLMALPTLVMGLLPTYQQIGLLAPLIMLLMRVIQGAAIGGEVPGAWVFVAEHVSHRRVALACGCLTAGLTAGILLGSAIAIWLTSELDAQALVKYGWRLAFILGGVFGLLALYLRRWLHETPVFVAMQQQKLVAAVLPIKQLFSQHKRALISAILLTWMLAAALVVLILMMPSLMQTLYHISAIVSLRANSWATVMLLIGCIIYGWLADRWGAVNILRIGTLLLMIGNIGLFYCLNYAPQWLTLGYAATGFSVGVVAIIPSLIVSAFPPEIRFTGTSVAYNFAYALFGGLTPLLVTLALPLSNQAPFIYLILLCVTAIIVSYRLPQLSMLAQASITRDVLNSPRYNKH